MKRRILSVIVAVIMNCILLQGSVSYAREPVAKGGLPASASYSPGSYEAVDESAVYSFKNAGSGLMLDVYGQASFSGTMANVQIYQQGTRANLSQKFMIRRTEDGWFQIMPLSNLSMVINPFSSDPSDGTDVNIYPSDPSDQTQGWYFRREGDAWVICSAWDTDLVLTAAGASPMSNVYLARYRQGDSLQKWQLQKTLSSGTAGSYYSAYYNQILQEENKWGRAYAKSCSNLPGSLSMYGLCWCQLIDMDGDDIDELVLVTNRSSLYQDYTVEIWSCDRGYLWNIYEGGLLLGGDPGSESLTFSFREGRYLLLSGMSGFEEDITALEKKGSSLNSVFHWQHDGASGQNMMNGQVTSDTSVMQALFSDDLAVNVHFTGYGQDTLLPGFAKAQIEQTKKLIRLRAGIEIYSPSLFAAAMSYSEVLESMKPQWDMLTFTLAFIDEDNMPELLITTNNSDISSMVDIYTFRSGNVIYLGCAGAFGTVDFIPAGNCLKIEYKNLSYDNILYWILKGNDCYCISSAQTNSEDRYDAYIDGTEVWWDNDVLQYREAMDRVYRGFVRYSLQDGLRINSNTIYLLQQDPAACIIKTGNAF
ncbi:MAG: RICIN domain-containing protein [Parasporobacterium sp.]|nr:RICIN domain-containing protein [Parasporobacterium sp.]